MTASTSTHSGPRKPTARPSVARQVAGKYVDILICGFVAWILSDVFGWEAYWTSLALFLWFGEILWCRDRLSPTAGEYSLGIRYMTSSSSHVVAEIQVLHPKLKLNGFILSAGVVELTLALIFLSGWTFFAKAALFGFPLDSNFSMAYWALAGLGFLLGAGCFFTGSKNSFWLLPLVHGFLLADFYRSSDLWRGIIDSSQDSSALFRFLKEIPFHGVEGFGIWSLYLVGVLFFSRKHLVN